MSAPAHPARSRGPNRGATRHAAGDGLEAMVARWHERYRLTGELVATKGNPATVGTPAPPGGVGTLRFGEASDVDYTGTARMMDGARQVLGVSVAFDVKAYSDRAHYLPPSTVDMHQWKREMRQLEFLRDTRRAGGAAFLLVWCAKLELAWVLTDVDALTAGRPVPIRSLDGKGSRVDHLPVVGPSTVLAVARGRPAYDYLPVALRACGFAF